jgi:hypothetical protein
MYRVAYGLYSCLADTSGDRHVRAVEHQQQDSAHISESRAILLQGLLGHSTLLKRVDNSHR